MSANRSFSRRQFLQLTGMATAGVALSACVAPVAAPSTAPAGSAPAAASSAVRLAVGGWAEEGTVAGRWRDDRFAG